MITVVSPRIHNLGDFMNCLPALSGFYKLSKQKIWLVVCDRMQQFKGLRELLMAQEMIEKVTFVSEEPFGMGILLDDTGRDHSKFNCPIATARYANYIMNNHKINFDIDVDFELQVPKVEVEDVSGKIVVGDRWSLQLASELDTRRQSNMIEGSGIMKDKPVHYLDYTKDLVYNCNLIKQSELPFITTFTGIGIIADLMKKDSYILWGDDIRNWDNKPIQFSFDLHYFNDRNAKLVYLNDFDVSKI